MVNNFLTSKTKSPLITVYITNHNYGNYIDQSIRSVLNQTLKNFELIIIDDGSNDNSKKIIKKYKNKKNIKIILQKNKGLIVSNNLALRLAKGKYIMRLDSDDWLDPHAIEIMSNILEQNKKIGLVFPDYFEVDKNGKILKLVRRHNFKKVKLLDQPAHGACTMIRKENLIDIGGYDEEFNCQDGYYLWLQFIKKYLVRNINLPLFYYRQHQGSLSRNEKKITKNRLNILKKIQKNSVKKKVLAIMPVRGLKINPDSLIFKKINNKPLVFHTIDNALKVNLISKLIITSPDSNFLKIIKKKYKKNVELIKRPDVLANINTELGETFKHVLKKIKRKKMKYDYIMDLSYRTPFLKSEIFEEAINTIQLFNADKIILVTQENHRFYKHDGSGLKSLIKYSNLRLERDALYRQIYGFYIVKKNKFFKDDEDLKIGHVVLNKKNSIEYI